MKNLMRAFALVAISFLAFSCSNDTESGHYKPTTLAKTIAVTPDFSSFNEALDLTGMKSMLDGTGTYTVLVPNNDAFAGLLGGLTVEEYYDLHPTDLENIVKYHIINSEILSKDLTDGEVISTSLGQDVTVHLEDNLSYPEIDVDLGVREQTSIYLNEGRVFARDAKASNGRIHVINAVLTPAGS